MTEKLLPPEVEREVSSMKKRLTILERRLLKKIEEVENAPFTLDAIVVERTSNTSVTSSSGIIPFQQVTKTGEASWGRWTSSDPTDLEIVKDGIYLLSAAASLNVGSSTAVSNSLVIQDPGGNPFAQIGPLKHSGIASPHDMHLDTHIVTPVEAGTTLRLRWIHGGGASSYTSGNTPRPKLGVIRVREGIDVS